MKRKQVLLGVALGAIGLGIACTAGPGIKMTRLMADDVRRTEKELVMERGTVKSLLRNDHDDVDGLLLENGLRVHFPPHMGRTVTDLVEVGDSIRVEGQEEVTPRGENVFEMTKLFKGKDMVEVERPHRKQGHPGPREEASMNAEGTVREYARNPHGEVDGLVLKNGTIVKFPPHQSRALQDFVAIGEQVTIDGRRHVTPHGDVHLHADVIQARGETIERDGPRHGPKGPGRHPKRLEQDGPTNAELLRELKAIRQLLESRQDS